jgi:putative transposase
MARIARVVVPDLPHHFTQRGNRREPVFFEGDDYRLYRRLIATVTPRITVTVYSTFTVAALVPRCPAPLAALGRLGGSIPASPAGVRWWARSIWAVISASVGMARSAAKSGNAARPHSFGAVVMDEPHLLAAARYIALNPVVAGLVSRAEDWPCSIGWAYSISKAAR